VGPSDLAPVIEQTEPDQNSSQSTQVISSEIPAQDASPVKTGNVGKSGSWVVVPKPEEHSEPALVKQAWSEEPTVAESSAEAKQDEPASSIEVQDIEEEQPVENSNAVPLTEDVFLTPNAPTSNNAVSLTNTVQYVLISYLYR